MIGDYFSFAWLMMRQRPVRATLSLLGIYTGALALVIILAIHEGARRTLEDVYRTQGAQVIIVQPGFDEATSNTGRLTSDDVERLRHVPGIHSVMLRASSTKQTRSVKASMNARLLGIDEWFFWIYRVNLPQGRSMLAQEIRTRQPVLVLNAKAARKLFPYSDAVGQTLDVEGVAFQVIGVADWTPEATQRSFISAEEPDFFVPCSWFAGGKESLPILEVRVHPDLDLSHAVDLVRNAVGRGDKKREAMYIVQSIQEVVRGNRESSDRALRSLLAIAVVSLVIGGIGIANVLLTSVLERTREIGVRIAVGARRIHIMLQFLIEAIFLALTGGTLAVITGAAGLVILPGFMTLPIPLYLPWTALLACLGLILVVGLLAGLYPASHAASLSPAEALRYE